MVSRSMFALAAIAGCATAQTGVPDQVSPWELSDPAAWIASFNLSDPGLVWQQQIRAGVDGRLEGVAVMADGARGAGFELRLRGGAVWSSQPALFDDVVRKQADAPEIIFIDMTAARIDLRRGDVFVLEAQGVGDAVSVRGPAASHYPEPLWLNAEPFEQWRLGFATYMLPDAGCFADCDASGSLDIFDFLCFQNLFAAGELQADCDGDGSLSFFDFLCFQDEFAAGCP